MALTALGATGVFANPQIASADKVVVGSNLGNVGTTKFQDNTEVANQSAINTVNSELRNVQTDSHGVIQLNTSIKDLPESQIPQVRQSISRLGGLIRRYNQLKDQLNTQNNTNRMLNGQSGADNTTYINNPEDINAAANQLEQVLNSMQQDIDYNNRVVGENAQNTSQNRALQDKVIQSNQTMVHLSIIMMVFGATWMMLSVRVKIQLRKTELLLIILILSALIRFRPIKRLRVIKR